MKCWILVALSTVLFLTSCSTTPKRLANVTEGHWKARALIKDLEQGRSYIVNLDMNAIRSERARMDVTSTLGTGVASLAVDAKEVRYILFDSKKFYFGSPQPDVMRPILAIPFDPRWLHNILFDEPIAEKSWTCENDNSGFLKECRDSASGLKITWFAREGDRKSVLLQHTKATVQINVRSFQPKVEDRKNLFVLEAPAGYQKLRVR